MKLTKGQTLIELLIATAVISTGLFASATLVFSNLKLSDRDSDEVVAVNLAREGIELAKQVRDYNWLAGYEFDDGLYAAGNDYSATPLWDGKLSTADVAFDFSTADFSSDKTIIRRSTSNETPDFFTQNDASADPTVWRRLIIFHPICNDPAGLSYKNDGEDCGTQAKLGIRVESRVAWGRKGQDFSFVLYEDLFDWR
ncbi:type II secretion system GspH family protein [Patescibacteria group bacterium]|nr:type II secretion system GspH family protein [Patescibacteria group bacterium]MBU1034904.1 type II secretion system GspH family protein [Patescibacteria group bacterium]MBU1629949.1 type II secretion system GspH family protein [Patescibacteria group bacterium]MBU1908271.1 type II secretion system GspH family protein [Patescibacteria group bacterium]